MNFLTEQILGNVLYEVYPSCNIIHNKKIIKTIRYRPDYCISQERFKRIYEFNGFRHYTSHQQILKDQDKRQKFQKEGYEVIEVPYFIQLTNRVCSKLLKFTEKQIDLISPQYINTYLHGFIDVRACNPFDFCVEGYNRYKKELEHFKTLGLDEEVYDIIKSENRNKKDLEDYYVFQI